MNYYKDELSKIITKDNPYGAQIKIMTPEAATKWLRINEESAKALKSWIDENFPRQKRLENLALFLVNDASELPGILDKLESWEGDEFADVTDIDEDIDLWAAVEHFDYSALMEAI
jgi:hypothetical protein